MSQLDSCCAQQFVLQSCVAKTSKHPLTMKDSRTPGDFKRTRCWLAALDMLDVAGMLVVRCIMKISHMECEHPTIDHDRFQASFGSRCLLLLCTIAHSELIHA